MNSTKQKITLTDYLTFLFFSFVFISSLFLYKEYGISWDEPIQRAYGRRVYDNTVGDLHNLETSSEKYYGPVFEFVLTVVENVLQPSSLRETYEIRHISTFLFNFLGFVFFYKVAHLVFKKQHIALLGAILLVLSPRIYAHAFYNSKDLVFMSSIIIASYFSLRFLENRTIWHVVLAGFFNALAIAIRVPGLIVPFITTLVFFGDFRFDRQKIKLVGIYAVVTISFVYLMWPTLWKSPIQEFINAIDQMRNFHETSATVFFGKNITGDKIPWFFVPVWVFITVPITQVFTFLLGLVLLIKSKFEKNKLYLFVLLWLFLPLGLVVFLKSTLYDGWRQMFFIYPAFILVGLYSFRAKLPDKYKISFLLIVLVNHIGALLFIYRNHPNHNVYFNIAAGPRDTISGNFALDYWGLVYKQLYERLYELVPEGEIKVFVDIYPGETNKFMVERSDRITIVKDFTSADYFLTNFRGKTKTTDLNKIYEVVVDDIEIGAIYRIN